MTGYVSCEVNAEGKLPFTKVENETWARLYRQQMDVIRGRACDEFIEGLMLLGLREERIPHLFEVSRALKRLTGWAVEPVPAVIGPTKFFTLLSERKFPCATFIRRTEDFLYIKEPDIFHELYGHCPMLTQSEFAKFVEEYGKFALSCSKEQRKFLFRLFWFTVEFGLIKTNEGRRIYGGGILSSIGETKSALSVGDIEYKAFNPLTIFRTPYRIDLPQKLYFVIENYGQLFSLFERDMKSLLKEAESLQDIKPKFPLVDEKGDILEYTN